MEPADFVFDRTRRARIGLDEAIFCLPKTPAQVAEAVVHAREQGARLLLTRLDPDKAARLPAAVRSELDYHPASRTGIVGGLPRASGAARVALVSAGTSDAAVAGEAERTLAYYGEASERFADIGVAGLWRLLERRDAIAGYPVVIALAGMEGALFSVLAGLVGSVVIAVPTSTGYGVAAGGRTALDAALGGCAPGVVAVNIDNGYGAACAALRVLNAFAGAAPVPAEGA